MPTLAERLAEINAETRAWVAAEDGRWAGTLVEDVFFWHNVGITTAEELDHYLTAELYQNLYKDRYGTRPRHMNLSAMSTEQIEALIEELAPAKE